MKKGQSALEFLMTYGWAILVVLAALGIMSYFGVINVGDLMPDKCVASTGAACVGKPSLDSVTGQLAFSVTNNLDTDLLLDSNDPGFSAPIGCTVTDFCAKGVIDCGNTTMTVADGVDFTIISNCTSLVQGTQFKGTFSIPYMNSKSGLTEIVYIELSGKVK